MELEELLVQEGVAAPVAQIRRVLERASENGTHAAAALIEAAIVGEDLLAEVMARVAGTIVIDLDSVRVDLDAPGLVSAEVARSHLVLPLGPPSGGSIRAVFVNPLDDEAIAALETVTGASVQPVVGTLSAVRRAIDQAYRERTTRVLRPAASDMAPEPTRKVVEPASESVRVDTAPLHKLEQEATPEQRHEALLLALIERGVLTRADYTEALKRLLRR